MVVCTPETGRADVSLIVITDHVEEPLVDQLTPQRGLVEEGDPQILCESLRYDSKRPEHECASIVGESVECIGEVGRQVAGCGVSHGVRLAPRSTPSRALSHGHVASWEIVMR